MNFADICAFFGTLFAIVLTYYLIILSDWNISTAVWGGMLIGTVLFFDVLVYQSNKAEFIETRKYYEDYFYYPLEINPIKIRSKPPLVPVPGEMFE